MAAQRSAASESHASPDAAAPTRRLALIVHTWGHSSSFFAWTFMKQYILRRVEKDGCTVLDPSEQLFIVKAGKDDDGDKWKMGGPLIPDLDTTVAHYPCTVVRLEGGAKSSIHAWLDRNAIDILVVGEHWPSGGLKMMSVSEWVKQNVSCPFLIIRRSAVANARMKISSSQTNTSSVTAATAPAASPEAYLGRTSPACPRTAAMTGRRIAIAYTSFTVGRGLMQFAKSKVLSHNDTIFLCHVFPERNAMEKNPVVHQTMKLVRVMTLMQRGDSNDEVTRDNSIDFGAAELAGYNLNLNVCLQGDAKSALTSFCESEDIELLIIGTRSGGKIRKKLSGGGVSSFLIDHAPCPCLVVPYKHMGIDDGRDTADEELMGTSPSSPLGWMTAAMDAVTGGGEGAAANRERGSSPTPPGVTVAADVAAGASSSGVGHSTPSDLLAALQKQLEEKDRVIGELRQQVHELQLAAAQREAEGSHDAGRASQAV